MYYFNQFKSFGSSSILKTKFTISIEVIVSKIPYTVFITRDYKYLSSNSNISKFLFLKNKLSFEIFIIKNQCIKPFIHNCVKIRN